MRADDRRVAELWAEAEHHATRAAFWAGWTLRFLVVALVLQVIGGALTIIGLFIK